MVVRKGSGEPLLLIHGLGASGNVWAPVVDLLASEREVIVLDMPGFGDEPALPADVEPTAANLAAAWTASPPQPVPISSRCVSGPSSSRRQIRSSFASCASSRLAPGSGK